LVNEAALLAARKNKDRVEMTDFELAKDKVMLGSERRSRVLSLEERRNTAYHEAGHALVAKLIPGTDPVHKVTIIPRGMALGLTQQVPIDDRHTYTRDFLTNNLAILFGGRVAEELCLQHMTTGAGNDLERATELARKMVCEWGMSEKLGPMTFGKKEEQIFLGRDFTQLQDYSNGTAEEIDKEVRRLIQGSYERANGLLTAHIHVLHRMAEVLLERESIDGADIDEILKQLGAKGGATASEPVAAAAS
jgi:cell division protease FtsH